MVELLHCDCMDYMKGLKDNAFELSIVDPPYGLPKSSTHGRGKLKNRILNKGDVHAWDMPPTKGYFDELFRVSKNQIIWGGNYFPLPVTRGFVIWDKQQPFPNFSAAEYAWMSFQVVSKICVIPATRTGDSVKIHETQKPVKLYEFLLKHYAVEGDRILDTHLGSGSSAIAAYNYKYDFVGMELSGEKLLAAQKRFDDHKRQLTIF
jgi:site-specific DNA-methyltransferase (adenine-specific)